MSKRLEKQLSKASKNVLVSLVILFMLLTCTFAYLWLTEYPSPLHKDDSDETGGTPSDDPTLIKNSDGTYNKVLSDESCTNLEVYYLDLKNDEGETNIGDSSYIKCNNVDIVIDAGIKNVGSTTVVPFLKEKVTDKTIELVIITHTDSDHIGGFVGLSKKEGVLSINDFTYKYVLESGFVDTTVMYTDLMNLISNSKAKVCNAYDSLVGNNNCAKRFMMGDITLDLIDTTLYNSKTADSNNRSIVTLLTHNQNTFLFTGDLEREEGLINNVEEVDIFKAGHHGSNTSNSSALLDILKPKVIIISTGPDGDTKHGIPQQNSLDRIFSATEEVYATFTTGTIKITSNGTTYDISCDNKVLFQNTEWFTQNRNYNN